MISHLVLEIFKDKIQDVTGGGGDGNNRIIYLKYPENEPITIFIAILEPTGSHYLS